MPSPDTRPGQPIYVGYGVALLASVAAVLGQHALEPLLDDRFPFAVFSAGVAAAAWAGGPGPGLLATALEAIAGAYFVLEPGSSLRSPQFAIGLPRQADSVALTLFVVTGILISLSMRRLRRQAISDRDARQEAERMLQHSAHLQDLTSALSRANTTRDVTHACLIELIHALGASSGALAVVTDDGHSYVYVDTVGVTTEMATADALVALDSRTPVAEAIRRHELVVVESPTEGDDAYPDRGRDPFSPPHQLSIAVPLVRNSRTVGAIVLLFDRGRPVTGDEHQFLSLAGSRTAQALDRARLYELTERARAEAEAYREQAEIELRERQRAEERLRESEAQYRGLAARTNRLYELSAGLSQAVTVDAVAKVIVAQGKIVVGASAASVALLVSGAFETLYAEGYPEGADGSWRRYPADPGLISTAAVSTRTPVLIPSSADLQKLYPQSAMLAADGGYASVAALPLLVEHNAIGVLALHFTAPVHFDSGYAKLLLSVAQHCAQALDRARLYESAEAARNEAEAANRSKDEFLSTVSHELRTPLNAMLGWASLLRNGTLDQSRSARALEAVFNNATRQAHLIEELLDVSRIVAGRAPLDPERLDISDNVRGAVEAILPLAEAKGVDVHVDAPHRVTVNADPRRLEQVFLNVLSNAVKFTPEGGQIRVHSAASNGRVEVTITDTGAGIDASFLPHVFERFRQADNTMARSVGGLGLGLFIARHLVEAQGGRIVAHSEGRGRGATFVVSFPILAARSPIHRPESGPEDHAEAPTLAGVRVLLVDDEEDAREMMTSALEACGAAIGAAASTSEALQLLAEHPYDVLLSDVAMPGADGYALIAAVRQTPAAYNDIPAAAVTASAGPDARVRAVAAGFQVHLAKPVRPQVLAATVAHLAGLRARPAPASTPAPQAG